jgi:SAM-dependent methyltransferase
MSQQHLQGFLADIRTINPQININDTFGTRTSLSGLITHLQATVNAPVQMTAFEARQHCANPVDPRLGKYVAAIDRLTLVWGRGAHRIYPQAIGFVPAVNHLNTKAQQNFVLDVQNAPVNLRPNYVDLERYDDDPWGFAHALGPGYLARVVVPGQAPLDITSRGLLLKAGLAPPSPIGSDNGYIASLDLSKEDLDRMQGNSVLDVGCGAAIFRAEMEVLCACETTGIDLNHAHIPAAVANGQSRYIQSTLYLKMMKDKGVLPRTSVPAWSSGIIDRQIVEMQNIVNAFADNLPGNGNVFDLATLRRTWNFTVCMFLLCYFDADQQTEAVLNMCSVTTRRVMLHSGQGAVISPRLLYDQAQVRAGFPGCQIVVKNERTHHYLALKIAESLNLELSRPNGKLGDSPA